MEVRDLLGINFPVSASLKTEKMYVKIRGSKSFQYCITKQELCDEAKARWVTLMEVRDFLRINFPVRFAQDWKDVRQDQRKQ